MNKRWQIKCILYLLIKLLSFLELLSGGCGWPGQDSGMCLQSKDADCISETKKKKGQQALASKWFTCYHTQTYIYIYTCTYIYLHKYACSNAERSVFSTDLITSILPFYAKLKCGIQWKLLKKHIKKKKLHKSART